MMDEDFLGPRPSVHERRWDRLEEMWEYTDALIATGRIDPDEAYVHFFCQAWNLHLSDDDDHFDPAEWIPEDTRTWRIWYRQRVIRFRQRWRPRFGHSG